METIQVRRCLRRDLPRVLALMEQLGEVAGHAQRFNIEMFEKIYWEMEKSPKFYLNLVAILEENVVGFISLIFYQTLFHRGGTALINELVVDQAVRGKGIGTILVREGKEEALSRGMDELEVGTEKTNLSAQAFYKRCGFDEEFILLGMEFA